MQRRDVLTVDGVLGRDALLRLCREERRQIVTEAIEALHDQDKDVLYHRYVHELPRKQIAQLMDIEVDQVLVLLQRASAPLERELTWRLSANPR